MQKQVIKFTNRSPYPNSIFIGNEDDNLSRQVQFVLPSEIDSAKIYLHLSIGEYSDVIELDDSLTYVPTRTHTQYPGNWTGYLEAHAGNDVVWHSNTFTFKVGDLPDSGEQIEQAYPSAIESALNEIRSLSQETELNAQQVSQDKQNVESALNEIRSLSQETELNAQQVSQDKQNVEQQIANINIEFNELKNDLAELDSEYVKCEKNYFNGDIVTGYVASNTFSTSDSYYRTASIYLRKGVYVYNPSYNDFGTYTSFFAKTTSEGIFEKSIRGELSTDKLLVKAEITEDGFYSFNIAGITQSLFISNFMLIKCDAFDDFPIEYIDSNKRIQSDVMFNKLMQDYIDTKKVGIDNLGNDLSLLVSENYVVIDTTRLPTVMKPDGDLGTVTTMYRVEINVKESEKYVFKTTVGGNVVAYVLKDKNGNVVSYASPVPYGTEYNYDVVINIPLVADGGTLYINGFGNIIVKKNKLIINNKAILGIYEDILFGKDAIFDGDSISQGGATRQPWADRIGTKYNLNYKNYSIGGGTFANISGHHCIATSLQQAYQEKPNAEYIIFDGGTNDADLIGSILNGNVPTKFGTWSISDFSGSYDITTFCGAVDYVGWFCTTHWKGKKIGYIVAQRMGVSSNGYDAEHNNRRAYFETAIKIFEKWGIPYIDLWNTSGLTPSLAEHYNSSLTNDENDAQGYMFVDGQHLTNAGYVTVTSKIEAWMKTL